MVRAATIPDGDEGTEPVTALRGTPPWKRALAERRGRAGRFSFGPLLSREPGGLAFERQVAELSMCEIRLERKTIYLGAIHQKWC